VRARLVAFVLAIDVACTAFAADDPPVGPDVTADGGSEDGGAVASPAFTIASGRSNPAGLATDGEYLYWAESVENGGIFRCPLAGCAGEPTPIAAGEATPTHLIATSTGLAWTALNATNKLRRMERDASPSKCSAPLERPGLLRVRSGTLYVFDEDGDVWTCPHSLYCVNQCTQAAYAFDGMRGGDVDTSRVYFGTDMGIRSCALGGRCDPALDGGNTILVPSASSIRSLVVDELDIYWVDDERGTVHSAPKTGLGADAQPKLLADGQNHPWRLFVDGTSVYVLNRGTGTDGELVHLPITGGPRTVLASGLARPTELVVDATHVYWTNAGTSSGSGTVMRVPKLR
jgi:hypothetical protein